MNGDDCEWTEEDAQRSEMLRQICDLTPLTYRSIAKRSGEMRSTISMMAREATPVTPEVAKAACELHTEWRENLQALSPTMSIEEWDGIIQDEKSGGA